jgi:signal transduction histidine kinase
LGLSLAKAVIDQHGGKITVESETGLGSTFQVWLPIRKGNEHGD